MNDNGGINAEGKNENEKNSPIRYKNNDANLLPSDWKTR